LLAIELRAPDVAGQWLALAMLERGLIVQPASQAWNVLRLEPPLTIAAEELSHATNVIGEVFDANRSVAPMLARTGIRAAAQFLNRGRFR
jgi:4-aminobutyrate aminotransferase-like enzyme